MPDPILPTPSSLPQTPVAPVLPNPQDMVDAALGSDTSTAKSGTLPPLTPLTTQTPEPAMTPTIDPVTPVVPMGDDTPLAFAGMPTPNSANQPVTPPPANVPVPPIVTQVPESKKKGKLGVVLAGIAILVVAIGVGGYVTTGKIPLIAGVLEDYQYNTQKVVKGPGGRLAVVKENAGTGSVGVDPAKDQAIVDAATAKAGTDAGAKILSGGGTEADANAAANAAAKAVQNVYAPQIAAGVAFNKYLKEHPDPSCKDSFNFDGTLLTLKPADSATDQCKEAHNQASIAYKNSVSDGCLSSDGGGQGCPVTCTPAEMNSSNWTQVTESGGGTVCKAGVQCNRYRIEMHNASTNKWCFVKYGEQCGGECGGGGGGTTTLTSNPTMKCDGLTSAPAITPAPVIGAKLTFTCAGTVTPASAGTLSYKFRYSINSGAVTAMTNKTATTSELTIAACGTYKVECQACATLNGVLTCSPVWTGATQ